MAEICEITELPKEQCAHCQGIQEYENKKPIMSAGVEVAMYEGRCPECGDIIKAGEDHIGKVDDKDSEHDGAWIHYGCGR